MYLIIASAKNVVQVSHANPLSSSGEHDTTYKRSNSHGLGDCCVNNESSCFDWCISGRTSEHDRKPDNRRNNERTLEQVCTRSIDTYKAWALGGQSMSMELKKLANPNTVVR